MDVQSPVSIRQLLLGPEQAVPYQLERRPRRSIGVYVYPDGRLVVRAPKRVSLQEIESFLATRSDWIRKHLEYFTALREKTPSRFLPGTAVSFLGEALALHIEPGRRASCRRDDAGLRLQLPGCEMDDEAALQRRLRDWLVAEGRRYLPSRLALWYQHLSDLNLPQVPLRVRHMRTRWGSCSSRGGITLNSELMKMPEELIDYVVLHELCHLREFNHGPGFQALMSRYMPDWQSRRLRLKHLAQER